MVQFALGKIMVAFPDDVSLIEIALRANRNDGHRPCLEGEGIDRVALLASDLLARTLPPPQELPIGIITSSVGAFFVVTMLIRNRL